MDNSTFLVELSPADAEEIHSNKASTINIGNNLFKINVLFLINKHLFIIHKFDSLKIIVCVFLLIKFVGILVFETLFQGY